MHIKNLWKKSGVKRLFFCKAILNKDIPTKLFQDCDEFSIPIFRSDHLDERRLLKGFAKFLQVAYSISIHT